MKTIKVTKREEIPGGFTGIVEYPDGDKYWHKEGFRHRIDGPAIEWADGSKEWWIDGNQIYAEIFIHGKLFTGIQKGKYGLEWLRFLTEERIEEYPIIPGLRYRFVETKHFTLEEFLNRKVRSAGCAADNA
jgi:hypothetical protein